ncbi:SET and MYND domain-containing protein 4 [Dissophora globulifera]|uniref:SET and MYND domain-containing protein 4 n=1 Tax=Dissophora globulifera TaxID=979702 RepID=A0A9P6RV18_9FUNG|nr:SET and MYND domain-containing protein 4 [Dissophora globulifera]
MASMPQHDQHEQHANTRQRQLSHEHGHSPDHPHSQLIAAFKGKRNTLDSFLDKPALACYDPAKLAALLAQPEPDLTAVKDAFTQPPPIVDRGTSVEAAIALGLQRPPRIEVSAMKEDGEADLTDSDASSTLERATLDPQFKIGFSKLYGHAIELNENLSGVSSASGIGFSKGGKVESGTFVFGGDEMPYACIIEKVWQGKRCEECLRRLPAKEEEIVECPACPKTLVTSLSTANSTVSNNPVTDISNNSEAGQDGGSTHYQSLLQPPGSSPRSDGPSRFCSRACLKSAWTNWHSYECGFSKELSEMKQLTRLALRVYWQNTRHRLSILELSPSPSSHSPFDQLDTIRRMSYVLTGNYIQHLFNLPDNATLEMAHLLAMVQLNSFAVKTQDTESVSGSESMTRLNDYTIGSALYLLASMFNHSCAPNAMVVFGRDGRGSGTAQESGRPTRRNPDPRAINVLTNRMLKVDPDLPVLVEISYGPQGGRMATLERKECLRRSHLFECNCSACNDRYAEAVLQKVYKCPKNGYSCRPMTEKDKMCPTCGAEIDLVTRRKTHQLMARLIGGCEDPSLSTGQRLALLKTLESTQSKVYVDTCILYGNTCDQLAMVYAESGDLTKSIEWCKKALKVVVVHFPHDSIEVAQETLKLAGLLFNNMQAKEAMKQVQIATTLYKGHYGANSKHPDLLELYEMERVLRQHI